MSRSIFQAPSAKTISGIDFSVAKVPLEAFDDALAFGEWLINQQGGQINLAQLHGLKSDAPVRTALERLLAACLAPVIDGQPQAMTVADVRSMPIPMVLEAMYIVLEENLDFFIQSLASIQPIQTRLMSIGLRLLNSSLPQDMTGNRSDATASAS